jgi:hypothetical protein
MKDGRAQARRQRQEELAAEARHARDRHRLYRAKVHGPGLTSPGRLRELERASNMAEAMLRRARSESGA